MNAKLYIVKILSILLLVITVTSACGEGSLSDASSDSGSSASTTLYLCDNGEAKDLTLECEAESNAYSYANLYPKYPNTQVDFNYVLDGDIQGTSYTFGLWLASGGKTTFDVSIIIQNSSNETVIATTSFTATSNDFSLFTETLEGIDPETAKGDVLVLRIFPASGDPGALVTKSDPEGNSYITIPTTK